MVAICGDVLHLWVEMESLLAELVEVDDGRVAGGVLYVTGQASDAPPARRCRSSKALDERCLVAVVHIVLKRGPPV